MNKKHMGTNVSVLTPSRAGGRGGKVFCSCCLLLNAYNFFSISEKTPPNVVTLFYIFSWERVDVVDQRSLNLMLP